MKSVSIATALLLHAAAIGTFVHMQSGHGTAQSRSIPFTVALLSDQGEDAILTHAARTPNIEPAHPASAQTPAVKRSPRWSQTISDAAGVASLGITSPTGSPSAAATIKTSAAIPASYAESNLKPEYPLLSRRQEEEGTVHLNIKVKADGTAGEIQLKRTSGYALLDESALRAVRNWRFTPASINNMPIAEWYQIAIPFKLHN